MSSSSGENAYTIIETLHKAQRFCVYKAKNYFHGNIVTIKTTEQRWRADAVLNKLLRNEAEAGLKLKHPHIRATNGLFEDEGTVYMVCDFVDGVTLNSLLDGHAHAEKWISQLLDALDYAHSQQVTHLGLNPDNILVTQGGDLQVYGFGKDPGAWKTADTPKNQYHPVLFLAPEVFREQTSNERADVYSIGVLAYLLVCGQLPWSLDARETPSQQKLQTFLKLVLDPELLGKRVPHYLYKILNKCLMLDPEQRFSSVAELRKAISGQEDIPYQSCLASREPIISVFEEPAPKPKVADIQIVPDTTIELTPVKTPEVQVTAPQPKMPPPVQERTRPAETKVKIPIVEDAVQQAEISRMKKLFRLLGIITIIIFAYILVKYVIIREKPKFSRVSDAAEESAEVEFKVQNKPIPLVKISGGTAIIGGESPNAERDEYPATTVQLKPYQIAVHEVTKEQWAMATPGYVVDDGEKKHPITNVSFLDAVEYCNAKSLTDGLEPCYQYSDDAVLCDFSATGYRLPTEAEWEFAAKAVQNTGFTVYSGSDSPDDVGWFADNSEDRIHPVKGKDANALGLYDMSGNAREWVWDWYAGYLGEEETPFSGPSRGTDRVIRGGSYKLDAGEMRVSNRSYLKPYSKASDLGFRVVRSAN